MTQTRRMQVLRAVVEDYIRSQEPVGSSALIARHNLKVSSATIRKDMAALEDEGFLTQPHTSAGRVPTERGYRYFVDSLSEFVPLTEPQREAIRTLLDGSVNLQDALQRSARLLARFTGQVAVVASPALSKARLWHLEVIAVSSTSLLAVVVTDTGRVAQHILTVPHLPDGRHLQEFCDAVNARCSTQTLRRAARTIRAMHADATHADLEGLPNRLADAFETMADEERTNELFVAGVSTLAHQHDSVQDLTPLFDALEERAVLMHLMSQLSTAGDANGVGVAIGSETNNPDLVHAAVVSGGYGRTTPYGGPDAVNKTGQEPIAFVGSIGPTHMNYEIAMAAVHAVARYLTALVSNNDMEITR